MWPMTRSCPVVSVAASAASTCWGWQLRGMQVHGVRCNSTVSSSCLGCAPACKRLAVGLQRGGVPSAAYSTRHDEDGTSMHDAGLLCSGERLTPARCPGAPCTAAVPAHDMGRAAQVH